MPWNYLARLAPEEPKPLLWASVMNLSSNRHPALSFCLSMIFSENRYSLFRIMLWGRLRNQRMAAMRFDPETCHHQPELRLSGPHRL
jgi:hypothetical protein